MRSRLVLPKNYCNRYQRQLMVTTHRSDEKSWNDAMQMVTFDIWFHQFTCGCSHARKIKVVHGTSKEYHDGINPFEPCIHFWQQSCRHFVLERASSVTMCWFFWGGGKVASKNISSWAREERFFSSQGLDLRLIGASMDGYLTKDPFSLWNRMFSFLSSRAVNGCLPKLSFFCLIVLLFLSLLGNSVTSNSMAQSIAMCFYWW